MKRKDSVPVRIPAGYYTFHMSIKNWANRSYFDWRNERASVSEVKENVESASKQRKRKLLKTLPKNVITLGEINFSVKEPEKIKFDVSDVDFNISVKKTNDDIKVSLEICSNSNKKYSSVHDLIVDIDNLGNAITDLLQFKFFWVIDDPNSLCEGKLKISICTSHEKSPILKATNIMKFFFGESDERVSCEDKSSEKFCTKEFFKELKNVQQPDLQFVEKDVQHEKLIFKLRPYQARAVKWMLFREREDLQANSAEWLASVIKTYKSKCNKDIYYNKYSGMLSLEMESFPPLPRGGILADEMGLGKTMAVICLVLNHTKNLSSIEGDFLSPYADPGEKNIIKRKKINYDSDDDNDDDEIRVKNKESYLNANERLICNEVHKGPALKRALTEWYESTLAEYSAATPSKVARKTDSLIKCVCGSTSFKSNQVCVECPECKRLQHSDCVGYQKDFKYFCPPCWAKQKLVESSATLIIAPHSIYHQWFDEIKKHVAPDTFKDGVFMYDGLKKGFIQPSVLAAKNIVITTYAILGAEINRAVQGETSRSLRNQKRFNTMCSPLCQINWWRMCLDEAQMVEKDYSQLNKMVHLVSAVNRWSVTGTPIQKSVSDLYYLIDWLGVEPYTEKTVWNNLLYDPYEKDNKTPLYSVLSKVLWRSSKEDVSSELVLPKQTIEYHYLKFTAVEQNFYMREHTTSSANFSDYVYRSELDLNQAIDTIDKTTLTTLLAPLLNLRQACSHPMAVKGKKIASKAGKMTLSELLQYLSNRTKVECEEAMRKYVAALNGLAGLYCIQEKWDKAVEHYRQVLQFTEEYKGKIQIDTLQRIHTMTNLAEVLEYHWRGIPRTLRDDSLKNEARALEDKYMEKAIEELKANEKALCELSSKILELEGKFESATNVWWIRIIHILSIGGSVEELLDKVSAGLITTEVESRKKVELFLSKISSLRGLEIVLGSWLHTIQEKRDESLGRLNTLLNTPSNDLVSQAVDCHLKPTPGRKKTCQLCMAENTLLDYECSLFDVSRKVLKEEYEKALDGAQTKGSWRSQNAEKCLKVLISLCKQKGACESWCLQDGKNHMRLLELLKKEFKQLRAVWTSINHRVQACDEIAMCKLRMRLRYPHEPFPPKRTSIGFRHHTRSERDVHIIGHYEVEHNMFKFTGELASSKSEFKKKYGTLLYLENLGKKENSTPEPCPVCNAVLDNEWCVLTCGHSFCNDCIRILLDRSSKPCLKCPVCRETTNSWDMGFVDLSGKQDDSDIKVVGDHSTKVEGVVRTLLGLKMKDPKVKVLVFSTWGVVLKILDVAFRQNGIRFRRVPNPKYQVHLREFRDPDSDVTALLLPLTWGSKGLNLTEASHVFLVEPILNPAEELQAIGRVHRIGQTKETFVHKFLIRGTIEEKINAAVSEEKDKWGTQEVTVGDLENLFVMKSDAVTPDN